MSLFKKILAVIDPETQEQKSLSRAIEIAQKSGASVTAFLSIFDFSYEMTTMLSIDERECMRQAVVDDRTDWLAALVESTTANTDVCLDVKVVWHNRPFESIIYEVQEYQFDLVVKGTHQHDTIKSIIVTPTDWHLLRKSPVPVLLVKDHAWQLNGQIAAALDVGSQDKEHLALNSIILDMSIKFADLIDAHVNVVSAYPGTPVNIAIEIPEFDPIGYLDNVKTHHVSAMNHFMTSHQANQIPQHVEEGLPEDVIPSVAKKIDAELVIMGTVGRSGISAALIGNTAEHVIDSLNCDVLALKPEGFTCPISR